METFLKMLSDIGPYYTVYESSTSPSVLSSDSVMQASRFEYKCHGRQNNIQGF